MAEDSRTLIQSAFAKARDSGRADWHRMSVAVLKNRLLDLTARTFHETDYGAPTFQEFVRTHDDILELDETTTPPVAILKGVFPGSGPEPGLGLTRIRSDLWRAVLDFSSQEKYVWDPVHEVAELATSGETSGPEIPTITADTFSQWKKVFARSVDDATPEDRLTEWVDNRRPANFLPPRLRHRWNGHLKTEVRNHLLAWFERQSLKTPSDLLEIQNRAGNSPRNEDLRQRLIACLRLMTAEELERVQIPASVLLRLKP